MINTVKIQNTGWLVNGNMSVPNDERNSDCQAVLRWLEGKTDDWLALEETFNTETAAHDNWLDITTYEARLAQYDIDIVAYNDWVAAGSLEPALAEPVFPVKPEGYYTQAEVDAYNQAWMEWDYDKTIYETENVDLDYPVTEPELRQRPIDLIEPIITPLPAPIPNVPEPEFSAEEIEAKRISDITAKATSLIEETYSPLKQRKMLSVAVALQDKQLQGLGLTVGEEALLQEVRDTNTWISNIRNIENTAIANGTLLSEVVF